MGVRRKHVFISSALKAVFPVVAEAGQHLADGLDAVSKVCFAGVVLKADDRRPQLIAGIHVVSDHALLGAHGVKVERARKVALHTVPRLIILPQHLIAAADGEHRKPIFNCGNELLRLFSAKIRHQHLLLKVLPAADEKQIVFGSFQLLTD